MHGVACGQCGDQPSLVGQVLHDVAAAKLRPLASICDGNADANLGGINASTSNQHASCQSHELTFRTMETWQCLNADPNLAMLAPGISNQPVEHRISKRLHMR